MTGGETPGRLVPPGYRSMGCASSAQTYAAGSHLESTPEGRPRGGQPRSGHLIKFLLEDQGRYAVTLAQDGLRGSLLVRDSDWDLVITDLNLPGADGMAVVEATRTTQPDTPILATTGYSGPQYADEALRKGATDILIKLLAKVEALVRCRGPLPDGSGSPPPPRHAHPDVPAGEPFASRGA